MSHGATQAAALFSELLRSSPNQPDPKRKLTKRLLDDPDPMTQVIATKLLSESLGELLTKRTLPAHPVVALMDRRGGKEGADAATAVIQQLGKVRPGAGLVHVSFATPSRGLGTLLRSSLARVGAKNGVLVEVVCDPADAEDLEVEPSHLEAISGLCDLTITLCPSGTGGLLPVDARHKDLLLSHSHLSLLSFPDPEGLVARLPRFEELIQRSGLTEIAFQAAAVNDGDWVPLASATLGGETSDARERLWEILDNAKRRLYRMEITLSIKSNEGLPLICPCRSALERGIVPEVTPSKIVPLSDHLLVCAVGQDTMI